MKLYTNHIGYLLGKPIEVILHTEKAAGMYRCALTGDRDRQEWQEQASGIQQKDWSGGYYTKLELTGHIETAGRYSLAVEDESGSRTVCGFEVSRLFLPLRMINAMRCYLKGERASGEWLKADRHLPFEESGCAEQLGYADLHGGWYDATGDLGVHLTQLSHTGKYNPVQSLLPGWVCFGAAERLRERQCQDARILYRELLDEGYWGADYAMRLKKKGGSFYRSVDRGEAFQEEQKRKIDFTYFHHSGHEEDESYREERITPYHYQVGFRGGAGIAVALLAQAARMGGASGEFAGEEYQAAAEEAFDHLKENNHLYINDGKWNLLDWYEMLIAALELYRLTGGQAYLESCRKAEENLRQSLKKTKAGKWFIHSDGEYFFHPSDEGMPLLALAEYIKLEPERARRERTEVELRECLSHLLAISENAFGYAGFIRKENGRERIRQFFPHDTEAAPWWQGENARIASLAAAVLAVGEVIGMERPYEKFAVRQLDWIMGVNPFDSCMIEGYGKNNIQYFFEGHYDFMNSPGGICNGITARTEDGEGIEFIMEPSEDCMDNWRWAEQWLPHSCWFLYAQSYLAV